MAEILARSYAGYREIRGLLMFGTSVARRSAGEAIEVARYWGAQLHSEQHRNPSRYSDLNLTDQDFWEFYLRRRLIPDLIYAAARLLHLTLVAYRADDPPMRYLLHVSVPP